MENLSTEEWLKKFPYLRAMQEYTLFLSREEVEDLSNSNIIIVSDKTVSIKFLKKILEDERFFNYAYKYFSNEIDKFKVAYIISGDTKGLSYNKNQIINGITELVACGDWYLSPQEQEKFDKLKKFVTLNYYEKNIGNQNYEISIDNRKFNIPIKNIIAFMNFSSNDFFQICKNDEIEYIYGFPKKYFIYAAFNYFKSNDLINKLVLPRQVENIYYYIKSNKFIDIEALNKFLKRNENNNITINSELKEKILEGMPNNISKLEQAIYIYIKMCKLLSYDEEYFAVNQSNQLVNKHIHESHIINITPTNNHAVCFEFNLIYSKLINELGINHEIVTPGVFGYGFGHASLSFRCDKFLVSADSVTSILDGDMVRAKLNYSLKGLKCMNKNSETVLEFKAILNKIYTLVADQEKKQNEKNNTIVGHDLSMSELLNEYSKVTDNKKEISLNDKFAILFGVIMEKIDNTSIIGIDALAYVLLIKKILFNQKEKDNNIEITILRNNIPTDNTLVADTIEVITINTTSYRSNPEDNIYYLYKPSMPLQKISLEELQTKFNNNEYEYIDSGGPKIPGISMKRL